jgi:hypothetical protein
MTSISSELTEVKDIMLLQRRDKEELKMRLYAMYAHSQGTLLRIASLEYHEEC